MNLESYGKKCKCGHFESEHIIQNNKFYEPNAIPEMGIYLPSPPTFGNPKQIKCRGCTCDKFSPKKRS